MNRYLVKGEAITEVVAIDEADAKQKFMEMLLELTYHFPSISRLETNCDSPVIDKVSENE